MTNSNMKRQTEGSERYRQTRRKRQTHRQTDCQKQTDTQTDWQKQTDTQTDRLAETDRHTDRLAETDRHTGRQTGRNTVRLAETDRQADRQTDTQTDDWTAARYTDRNTKPDTPRERLHTLNGKRKTNQLQVITPLPHCTHTVQAMP